MGRGEGGIGEASGRPPDRRRASESEQQQQEHPPDFSLTRLHNALDGRQAGRQLAPEARDDPLRERVVEPECCWFLVLVLVFGGGVALVVVFLQGLRRARERENGRRKGKQITNSTIPDRVDRLPHSQAARAAQHCRTQRLGAMLWQARQPQHCHVLRSVHPYHPGRVRRAVMQRDLDL